MNEKGNRRGISELIKLLDAQATWVVRTKSGVIGNASSLRAALDLAARKSHENDLLDSIDSVTRFDGTRLHIPKRQARQLLQLNGQTAGAKVASGVALREQVSLILKRAARLLEKRQPHGTARLTARPEFAEIDERMERQAEGATAPNG
jgi:hypothetical protein